MPYVASLLHTSCQQNTAHTHPSVAALLLRWFAPLIYGLGCDRILQPAESAHEHDSSDFARLFGCTCLRFYALHEGLYMFLPVSKSPSSAALPTSATRSEQASTGLSGERSLPTAGWSGEQEQPGVKHGNVPKRPAPADAALTTSRANKVASMRPYKMFCQRERPLLPASLSNSERERALGERWRALSEAERVAKWGSPAQVTASTSKPTGTARGYPASGLRAHRRAPFPIQRPAHLVTPDRATPDRHLAIAAHHPASAQQTAPSLADRWTELWEAKEACKARAKAAARPASGDPLTTLTAPPPALAEPSAPAAPAAAQPHTPSTPSARDMAGRIVRPPAVTPAARSTDFVVLPNGTTIQCFPRMYLHARSTPAAPLPSFPRMYLAARPKPAAPAPASVTPAAKRSRRPAAASKEEVPAAAEPKAPPAAPVSPPSMALPIYKAWLDSWMDQLLRTELEHLTPEEAMEAFLE